MAKLSSTQARELAAQCRTLCVALGDYRFANLSKLTEEQRRSIEEAEEELLRWSTKLLAEAIRATLGELKPHLERVADATHQMKEALARIDSIRGAIEIATAAIQLGRAIATGNPAAVLPALDRALRAVSGE